jgi:CTP:molybdopterin cytidylyltransferase MocA
VRGDDHGHPVLIDRSLFPILRAADPSLGIKPIVRAHVSSAGDVVVDDTGAFLDIDTPDAYQRTIKDIETT